MLNGSGKQLGEQARLKWPHWAGYLVTLALEGLLTAGLVLLYPIFPLGKFPIPYILLIMVVGYLFGAGPAVLAFFVGFIAFNYFFVYPLHIFWPPAVTVEGWARVSAFLIGTLVVGLASILVRRYKRRVDQLVIELDRQRTLLDTFMQHISVGLAFHGRDTRHLLANKALAELSGTSREQILGKTVWEVLPTFLADEVAIDIEHVFTTGKPTYWRDKMISLGGERYFDIQHMPVKTQEGDMLGVGAVVMETTDQVHARQELERSYEREHKIAETLQESLLGTVPDRLACFGFETAYKAAFDEARVGGDFYDVFAIGPHKVGIVVGDVSGKGLKAAIQIAMAKYSIRGRAYEIDSPSAVLKQVNEVLVQDMDEESFITTFVGVLDCDTGSLTYSNGGHEPVMFWDSTVKTARLLDPTGPLVGMEHGSDYEERTIRLQKDDELLLSTDGLLEVQINGKSSRTIDELLDVYTEAKLAGACTIPSLINESGTVRDDIAILRVWIAE